MVRKGSHPAKLFFTKPLPLENSNCSEDLHGRGASPFDSEVEETPDVRLRARVNREGAQIHGGHLCAITLHQHLSLNRYVGLKLLARHMIGHYNTNTKSSSLEL